MTAARGAPLPSTDAVLVTEVELSDPIGDICSPANHAPYRRAVVLARLHGAPLGLVELELSDGGLCAEEVARTLWSSVAASAERHLAEDGVAAPVAGGVDGIKNAGGVPRCERDRAQFLRDAPPLTVVIPTRDRPDHVRTCLTRILENSEYPTDRYEILIVDNAPSTDATRRVVAEFAERNRVRYAREDSPGSASARNTGIAGTDTELLVFTDDDAIVDRHWLTRVAMAFAADPDVGAVTGSLLPRELETPAQLWFEQYGGFSRGFEPRLFDLVEHRDDGPLYPYSAGIFGTGNNMSFRMSVLRDIGGFDPALGNGTPALGGVDSEALLRTVLAGHRIAYDPAAIVWHTHRPDYAGLQRQVYSYGVGLTAYLTKVVLHRPDLLIDFIKRIPRGLWFALSPGSDKNHGKQTDYPRELTRLELRGMAYGPIAYLRSRVRYGRHHVPAWSRRRVGAPRRSTS
jgi:glycosyltransferase involved in cell wall biosynthesis